MCYSATASFAVGAALVPAGVYCTSVAVRRNAFCLPLALVPFAFAIQQFCEGLVWVGLNGDDASLVQGASVAYLYFAIGFWPFWIPFSFLCTERRPVMKWSLAILTGFGLAWTWLYLPILFAPNELLTTDVVGHSVRYAVAELPGHRLAPRSAWMFGYFLVVAIPLAIGCTREQARRGDKAMSIAAAAALAASFAVSYYLYWQVFMSVWCFFAALLALVLCHVFYRLPAAADTDWPAWRRQMSIRG